jgi:hypothetical protein
MEKLQKLYEKFCTKMDSTKTKERLRHASGNLGEIQERPMIKEKPFSTSCCGTPSSMPLSQKEHFIRDSRENIGIDFAKGNSESIVKSYIVSRVQVEGFHLWHKAPPQYDYLSHPHRHIFHVVATREVFHDNRDVEFIHFARQIKDYLEGNYYSYVWNACLFGSQSCEMLARELLEAFDLTECEVSEDGENSGLVRRY